MNDHIFLSYSSREWDSFVNKLAVDLKKSGVPLWVDRLDIPIGADWDQEIDEALYGCRLFLIILSPESVASKEVRGELRVALEEEKSIIPVLYRKCRIPRRLRLLQYIDFTDSSPEDHQRQSEILKAIDSLADEGTAYFSPTIFISSSLVDSHIVDQLDMAYTAAGIQVLHEVRLLRSSQALNSLLLDFINKADIFLLCWSSASRTSLYVEQEWRHALSLKRSGFIRTVYWERPMPSPPDELMHIHFAYYPILESKLRK
jgi:hypothetical protein